MQTAQPTSSSVKRPVLGTRRVGRALALAFSAFTTGARLIPMGDNGQLLKSLAAKTRDR